MKGKDELKIKKNIHLINIHQQLSILEIVGYIISMINLEYEYCNHRVRIWIYGNLKLQVRIATSER
jgi:hypothetical protein